MSIHTLTYGKEARKYDTTDFQDGSVKRILKKLSDIERAGLPDEELKEVRMGCVLLLTQYFRNDPLFIDKHHTVHQPQSLMK